MKRFAPFVPLLALAVVLGPRSIKLWNYDPAELNDDLNQFRAQGGSTQLV